jgi:pimeloyl-ACP methyl ester carboxylesterase
MIDKLCKNDYELLKPFIYNLFSGDDRSMGMRLSVWCSEEYPFEQLRSSMSKTSIPSSYQSVKSEAVPLQICKIWKVTPASEKENKPFKTNVPVLLINGEFDPDTPSAWGERMQKEFTKSYHFVFKGMSHTPTQYWDNSCGMQLAQAFFDNPYQQPTLKCFTELKPLVFDTSR